MSASPSKPSKEDTSATSTALTAVVQRAVDVVLREMADDDKHVCMYGFSEEETEALRELVKLPGDLAPGRDPRKGVATMRKNHFAVHDARNSVGNVWSTAWKIIAVGGISWVIHWVWVGFKESLTKGNG